MCSYVWNKIQITDDNNKSKNDRQDEVFCRLIDSCLIEERERERESWLKREKERESSFIRAAAEYIIIVLKDGISNSIKSQCLCRRNIIGIRYAFMIDVT